MESESGEAARQAAASEVERVVQRLRREIARSGLSQRELERRLGWGEGYLSQLLTGKVDLKFGHLLTLTESLGLSAEAFFAELYSRRRDVAPLSGWTGGAEELRALVSEVLRDLEPKRRAVQASILPGPAR